MTCRAVLPRIYALLANFFSFTPRNRLREQPDSRAFTACDLPWPRPVWHLCNTVNNFRMDKKCAQLWQRLSAALKPQISADSFKRWFSAVELVEAKDKSLTLRVPNNIYQFWIESNYMPALQTAIVTTFGGPRPVKFCSTSGTSVQMPAQDAAPLETILPDPPADTNPAAT